MDVSLLVPLGIVVAAVLGALCALVTLSGAHSTARRADEGAGTDALFLCPKTDEFTHVRLGVDPAAGGATVLWCERFAGDQITCDRACFAWFRPLALQN